MDAPGNIVLTVSWLVGGLALFLYGIEMMGTAMRRAAGPALRKAFDYATATRWHGLAVGTGVTALIQSSSATTVMVVGFINAGLMTFEHSIGVILGANIGATVTPMITAWGLDTIGLPLAGVGFAVAVLSRQRLLRQLGWACMGFGMLVLGLGLMKAAVAGYREPIRQWLSASAGAGGGGQVLAFLVATAATAIVQSSAATIAMMQALAAGGALANLGEAVPLILGAQVGTCVTGLLAGLQASRSARRAAVAHLLFNVIGVLITLVLYHLYLWVLPMLSSDLPTQMAHCNLAVRLVNACLFVPFAPLYAKLIVRILPGKDELSARPEFLDFRFRGKPAVLLRDAAREIRRIYLLCMGALRDAVDVFLQHDGARAESVLKRETLVDDLSQTTREYLIRLAREDLPAEMVNRPALWMHVLNDVERVGDHAENLVEIAEIRRSEHTRFSETAVAEIRDLCAHVLRLADQVEQAMDACDEADLADVLRTKRAIDIAVEEYLDSHAARLEAGTCKTVGGMIFVEVVTNLRRVANHLRNVAASVTSRLPEPARQIHRLKQELHEERLRQAEEENSASADQ